MPLDVGRAVGYLDLDTSGFTRGFSTALSSLRTFQSESASISDKLAATGTALTSAGSTLTRSVTVPLVGLGTAAVATTTKFEAAMSQVQATMGITRDAMSELDGETVNSMDALSALAQELGATTKFSAVEAAEAINYMALAGYDVEKTYGMLPTVLNLAAAGNFDLARASDMVTDTQTALGLSIEETTVMIDEWARAASRSNTSVEQLGDAILTVGGTAQYMAGGTDRIATVLGVLADNGIKGTEAGTKLRNMILKLADPTDAGYNSLKRLNVSIFDMEGNMRDFQDIFLDFQTAMEDMTEEEKISHFSNLFNVRDIAAANALLNTSVERWEELGGAISDAEGAAAQMSETQLDNLNGQLTILKSSLEGMAIAFGELLLPLIKDATSAIQSAVTWINNLDESQKETLVRVLEIAAAVGPVFLIVGKLVTLVSSVGKAFTMLKTSLSALTVGGGPLALILVIIVALVAAFKHLWDTNEEFRERITAIWESVKEKFQSFADGVVERLNSLGFDFENIVEVLQAAWEGFCNILAPLFEGAFSLVADTLSYALDQLLLLFDLFSALFQGDWEGVWEAVKGIFENVWEFITNMFGDFLGMLSGVLDTVLGWFGTSTEDIWNTITEAATNIWNTITETAQNVWNGIVQVVTDIVDFFKTLPQTISEIIAEIVEWFEGLPERIGYAIGFVVGTIARWAVDLYNTVVTEVPKIIDQIVTFFSELPGKVWEWLLKVIDKIKNWGADSVQTVKEEVPKIIDSIISFFSELPGKVWDWFKKVIDKIQTWVDDMVAKVKELFPQVVDAILGFFKDIPSQLSTIGENLIDGLWGGIQSAGRWIGDKAESVGNAVIEGFQTAFDSHSPSRKMIAQGKYLMMGLAKGIDDNETSVFGVLNDLFYQLFNRFDALFERLDGLFEFDFASFSDAESQDLLLRYNTILKQTLQTYRDIEICLKECSAYAESLFKGQYLKAISFAQNVSQAIYSPSRPLYNSDTVRNNADWNVMASYLAQILQIAKSVARVEPKQPVTIIFQASSKEITRLVIDDINNTSRMNGESVIR